MRNARPLTILCHNVFWFQGAPFATDQPPSPDARILDRLCTLYRSIAADVLCLQEIQGLEAFQAVAAGMGLAGAHCRGNAFPQYGGALLWQSGLGAAGGACNDGSPQRMWQGCEVAFGGGVFTVCNVHLPSGRQLGPERAARQRVQEILAVIDGGRRVWDVIAGDFNERSGGDAGRCLQQHGYRDVAVLAGRADRPTNVKGGRGDYIWLGPRVSDRLVDYGVTAKEEFQAGVPEKAYLSDHLPLWVTLAP